MKDGKAHGVIKASLTVADASCAWNAWNGNAGDLTTWDWTTRHLDARIRKRDRPCGQRNLHWAGGANRLRLLFEQSYVRGWRLQGLNAIGIAHQESQVGWPDYPLDE